MDEAFHHPEAIRLTAVEVRNLEISSMADIPSETGLGSSGSFTTALLRALHTHKKHLVHPHELAEAACHLEIDILGEPIGKQDQYIAAFGGITCFEFGADDSGKTWPLGISEETLKEVRFGFDFEGTRVVSAN